MGIFDGMVDRALQDAQHKADYRSFGGNIKELGGLSHADLSRMRRDFADNQVMQSMLAPFEHRAFAREWTAENPMVAAPSLAAAIPLYYAAKNPVLMGAAQKLGLVGEGATPASLEQMKQSYQGVGEGLWNAFQQGIQSIPNRTANTNTGSSPTGLLGSLQNYLRGSNTPSTIRQ